jgi:hypothetical protein
VADLGLRQDVTGGVGRNQSALAATSLLTLKVLLRAGICSGGLLAVQRQRIV